jgi:hypothetical protein
MRPKTVARKRTAVEYISIGSNTARIVGAATAAPSAVACPKVTPPFALNSGQRSARPLQARPKALASSSLRSNTALREYAASSPSNRDAPQTPTGGETVRKMQNEQAPREKFFAQSDLRNELMKDRSTKRGSGAAEESWRRRATPAPSSGSPWLEWAGCRGSLGPPSSRGLQEPLPAARLPRLRL